ncbi:MAG: type IV pilus assembly protein PilM [Actinobacteria bacterium]|nr:type IV pilus assembly protein PilM [Actinomycetota bacterium]
MPKTRIGVDVGSTAVRVAEVAIGDVPVVVRAAQVPLAPGLVEAGEVREPEAVGAAIRQLWEKAGIRSRQAFLGVGNQRVVVREVALPWLPERELRNTLAFQVQEFIPMSTDDAVLDFDPVGEVDQGGRRMQRILLVAAHKAMVNALVEAALAGKLDPAGVDLSPFAVVRAIGSGDEALDLDSSGDEAVIDIGAHVTSICVHDRGVTRFVRMLPSGGRDITIAIARGFGIDDDVAERLKRGEEVEASDTEVTGSEVPADVASESDAPEGEVPDTEAPAAEEQTEAPDPENVKQLALTRAGSFIDEVRSSLEFYAAQVPSARIGCVLVVGGGSRLDGFLELLQERLPVPVDRGRLFERAKSELELSVDAAAEAEAVLSVAVGLAIPSRRNL